MLTKVNSPTIQYSGPIPYVVINLNAYLKMESYVKNCDKEIGWLGFVEKINGNLYVRDVVLFEQQVGAATCEITGESMAEFGMALLDIENGETLWEQTKLWGHSHVNMGVFPSQQDEDQLKVFKDSEWFLRLIMNKKGELNFTYIDFVSNLKISNLSYTIFIDNEQELDNKVKTEIGQKVSEITYTHSYRGQGADSESFYGDFYTRYGRGEDEDSKFDSKLCKSKRRNNSSHANQKGKKNKNKNTKNSNQIALVNPNSEEYEFESEFELTALKYFSPDTIYEIADMIAIADGFMESMREYLYDNIPEEEVEYDLIEDDIFCNNVYCACCDLITKGVV